MKQSRVSAFGRVARSVALATVVLVLGAGTLLAQATGKIEGRVRDQAGAPIANAQVFIVGTAFNALTNPQGYYFINNVPSSTVSVRAAFIGYKSTQVDGVKILAGQTGTVDIQLEATAVEIQEITVVSQTQPLVPRDEVTTKQRVDGAFAEALPVDNLNEVLQLQPGVIEDTDGGLSIRGGRENENATYIDGVPTQAGYRGDAFVGSAGTELTIGTNAFEEASITTGSSSAEFGNAKSGIISIVTKTGGSEYQGSLGYETDEAFGVNNGVGFNRIEGGISGPLAGRLTFALNGTLEGRKSVEEGFSSQDTPIFLQAGVDTTINQVSILADDPSTPFDERLSADTSAGRHLQLRGEPRQLRRVRRRRRRRAGRRRRRRSSGAPEQLRVRLQRRPDAGHRAVHLLHDRQAELHLRHRLPGVAEPGPEPVPRPHLPVHHRVHQQPLDRHAARLQQPEPAGDAELDAEPVEERGAGARARRGAVLSAGPDAGGPLTIESGLDTRDPFGGFILRGLDFEYNFDNFPVTQGLIDNIRRNQGRITPIDVNNGSNYLMIDRLRNNAYGLYGNYQNFANTLDLSTWSMGEQGRYTNDSDTPTRLSLYKEDRYIGKATLDWQADRYNRLKIGGELTQYDIDNYSFRLTDKFFSDAYLEKPVRWNSFVEDRLDLGDVVVVGGLRYDWYDTRASRPYATDTAGNTYAFPRVSTMPGFDMANPTSLFVRDQSHGYLSPHVQVSFPVTDRTNFRLSYSHQVQAPDFGLLLGGINIDLGNTNTNQVFGSDLDFGKTIAFEFGIRHAFSDDMVLDVAAYNKDIVSDPAARLVSLFDPAQGRDNDFRILTNLDFGNVRGLDVRLDRRFGNFFNGTIAYAYQQAKNTGSDPFTYTNFGSRIVNQVGGNNGAQPPPQGILPTDDSRPHALTGALSVTIPGDFRQGTMMGSILKNVSVFSTFRYTSGTAYTKCGESNEEQSVLSIENCVRLFPEGLNTQRLPAFKELNARLTKSFGLGGLDMTGYLDVRNLLNFRNVLQVFAVNGDIRNDEERADNLNADLDDLGVERDNNNAVGADGAMVLPTAHEDCAGWVSSKNDPAASNCMYLIRAEQRFGNGDHVFTVEEQTNAVNALYDVARGEHQQLGVGRRARLGFEINF